MVFTIGAFLSGRGSGLRRGRGAGAGRAPSRRARSGWRRAGEGGRRSHCPWCGPAASAAPGREEPARPPGSSPLLRLSDAPVPSRGPRAVKSFTQFLRRSQGLMTCARRARCWNAAPRQPGIFLWVLGGRAAGWLLARHGSVRLSMSGCMW